MSMESKKKDLNKTPQALALEKKKNIKEQVQSPLITE